MSAAGHSYETLEEGTYELHVKRSAPDPARPGQPRPYWRVTVFDRTGALHQFEKLDRTTAIDVAESWCDAHHRNKFIPDREVVTYCVPEPADPPVSTTNGDGGAATQPDYVITIELEERRWPFSDRWVARARRIPGDIWEFTCRDLVREQAIAEAEDWCSQDREHRRQRREVEQIEVGPDIPPFRWRDQ